MTDESGTCRSGTYRIECLECGSWVLGDPDDDLEQDKQYHRDHHCPDADFEVIRDV